MDRPGETREKRSVTRHQAIKPVGNPREAGTGSVGSCQSGLAQTQLTKAENSGGSRGGLSIRFNQMDGLIELRASRVAFR